MTPAPDGHDLRPSRHAAGRARRAAPGRSRGARGAWHRAAARSRAAGGRGRRAGSTSISRSSSRTGASCWCRRSSSSRSGATAPKRPRSRSTGSAVTAGERAGPRSRRSSRRRPASSRRARRQREQASGPKLQPAAAAYRRFAARFPFGETDGSGARDRGGAARPRAWLAADGPAGLRRRRLRQDRGRAARCLRRGARRQAGGGGRADHGAGAAAPRDLPASLRRLRRADRAALAPVGRRRGAHDARRPRRRRRAHRRRDPCPRVGAGRASPTSAWSSSTRSSASAPARRSSCAGCARACTS